MNLKLVVTTMIVAGAVSANAFADQNVQAEMDAMQAQLAQIQASMNANGAGNNLPSAGWFNRLSLSGLMNIDATGSKNYSPTDFTTHSPSSIAVSSAALYLDADVSDWTKAHVGVAYSTSNQNTYNLLRPGAYTNSEATSSDASLNLDEAYATIANFAKSPFYLKAGKQYLPFGSYTPFADITPALTQVLSQVNDPAATVGFVTNNGFNGSVYALQGVGYSNAANTGNRSAIQNYGASLALNNTYNNIGYNAGFGYLSNMADVTGVAYALTNAAVNPSQGYHQRVGGLAGNLGVKYAAFDIGGKWVGAMKKFNSADVAYVENGNANGAKPAAWGVDAGYSFPVLAHGSRFGLGYQGSKQAVAVGLVGQDMPRTRYLADYTVNVSKYTDLGFELRHDTDYSVSNGGTGNSTNTAVARLAVKFA